MKTSLYLLLLVPMFASAQMKMNMSQPTVKAYGGDSINEIVNDIVNDNTLVNDITNEVSNTVQNDNVVKNDNNVQVQNSSGVNIQDSPSAAYAYAAQCGTGGGVSTGSFGASVSGESQYCKNIRLAAFYEGLYVESKNRGDNSMANIWYNQMAGSMATAHSLVESTAWTGAMKETAGDLLLPVALCGGLSAAATPAAGYICAIALGIKATEDIDRAKELKEKTVWGLEVRDTQFIQGEPVCAYVNGELHQYMDCPK